MATLSASDISHQELAVKALDTLPPFSPVLNRLLASLADEEVSFARLAGLIEKDTVLAGSVLRVVNSAAYGCRGSVNSVAHAIAIMGLAKLRNTALSFSVSRLWRSVPCAPGWSMANFNLHSISTAILADLLAQRVDVKYPEGAFISGLFHDLGKLLIAVALPREYQLLTAAAGNCDVDIEQEERSLLSVTHADLSAIAVERWNLPRPIQLAVAFHHEPRSVPPDAAGQNRYSLADVVSAADRVTNALGISVWRKHSETEGDPSELPNRFGFDVDGPKLLDEFRVEYDAVKALF